MSHITIIIFAIVVIFLIAFATYLIGRYFRSQAIKDLKQQLKDEALQYDVLVSSLRTDAEKWEVGYNERGVYVEHLERQIAERERIASEALAKLACAPKFQIVPNTKKHHFANDKYLYLEGEIDGKREAGMLRLSQWEKAKETLRKNPEDRPV